MELYEIELYMYKSTFFIVSSVKMYIYAKPTEKKKSLWLSNVDTVIFLICSYKQ